MCPQIQSPALNSWTPPPGVIPEHCEVTPKTLKRKNRKGEALGGTGLAAPRPEQPSGREGKGSLLRAGLRAAVLRRCGALLPALRFCPLLFPLPLDSGLPRFPARGPGMAQFPCKAGARSAGHRPGQGGVRGGCRG